MTSKTFGRSIFVASAAAVAVSSGFVLAHLSRADEPLPSNNTPATAISRPSRESKLAFALPGIVVDVAVKDGDVVKQDQVLASQDSRQDEFALKSMQLEADSKEKIRYSEEDKRSKEVKDKRVKDLYDQHVAAKSELEEADLAVQLADAQIALARLENDQKNLDAKKQAVKIAQMQIHAPYDGIVEKVIINPGEMADPQIRDGAIVIGQWDPLWVEMHLPSSQAAQLKMGQTLDTKYEGDSDWKAAKIVFFEKVDPASDTQMVRMELPNPGNAHPAGLHLQVKLPEKLVATADR